MNEAESPIPDVEYFLNLSQARMPFGKYKDRRLKDLPESYLIWMARKGYPKGTLGIMLKDIYEIKLNGLEVHLT